MEDILPCPFCGSDDIYLGEVDEDFCYHIGCRTHDCPCSVGWDFYEHTEPDAIKKWNGVRAGELAALEELESRWRSFCASGSDYLDGCAIQSASCATQLQAIIDKRKGV